MRGSALATQRGRSAAQARLAMSAAEELRVISAMTIAPSMISPRVCATCSGSGTSASAQSADRRSRMIFLCAMALGTNGRAIRRCRSRRGFPILPHHPRRRRHSPQRLIGERRTAPALTVTPPLQLQQIAASEDTQRRRGRLGCSVRGFPERGHAAYLPEVARRFGCARRSPVKNLKERSGYLPLADEAHAGATSIQTKHNNLVGLRLGPSIPGGPIGIPGTARPIASGRMGRTSETVSTPALQIYLSALIFFT